MIGSKYALALSSCLLTLFQSLKALRLLDGARVLIPGFTFAAVPLSVLHAGYRPVLCEANQDYRVDLNDFAAKPHDNIDAVVISHKRRRKIGTIGRIGCFSFQSYKMINAGEGGIPITDDADLVACAIIMSGGYEHN